MLKLVGADSLVLRTRSGVKIVFKGPTLTSLSHPSYCLLVQFGFMNLDSCFETRHVKNSSQVFSTQTKLIFVPQCHILIKYVGKDYIR